MIRDVHGIRILNFYPSRIRIQRSKRHRIPDPDPQHCWHATDLLAIIADPDPGSKKNGEVSDPESMPNHIVHQ
jgi:hypothetical protein